MSYGSGFHYSPYYQGNAEQDGRNQQSHPNLSGGNATSYQRQSNSSMTTTPTTQPYSSAQPTIGATNSEGYHASRVGTQPHAPPAIDHYPANSRSSIDTTALGNLAYASSLGQDSRSHPSPARNNSSMQHIVDYNRSKPTNAFAGAQMYEMVNPTASDYDHRRSEIREPASTRSTDIPDTYAPPPPPPYSMYSDDGKRQQQPYTPSHGHASSPQAIQRPDSAARIAGAPSKKTPLVQPPRPSSGQNGLASHSRLSSQGNQSPSLPQSSHQPTPLYRVASNGSHVSEHSHPQPQQAAPRPAPASSQNIQHSPTITNQGRQDEHESRHQTHSPSLDHRVNSDNQDQSPHHETQIPTTIDPTMIFNQVEHLRRQAVVAAEAETAKRATEDAARRKAQADAEVSAKSGAGSSISSTKDQMELEMKQMIEKMRDYKARDPNLFSQIWEQVKKGQPSNRPSSLKEPDKAVPTVGRNTQLPSPSSIQNQLPQESELSVPPLQQNKPKQEKPPQKRRRRSAKNPLPAEPTSRRQTSGVTNVTPLSTPGIRPSSAGHPVSARPTSGEPDVLAPGAQSIQAAMDSFNKDRKSREGSHTPTHKPEIVYVSGTGPIGPSATELLPPTNMQAESVPVVSTSVETVRNAGGTIWPQERKWALANAAKNALTSSSINAGKSIAAEDIVRLLDQSPSYAQLCEILERRGFIIDRGHFARLLLIAVPGLDSDDPKGHNSGIGNVSIPQSGAPQSGQLGGSPLVNNDNDLGLLLKNHNDSLQDAVDNGQNGVTNNGNGAPSDHREMTNGHANANAADIAHEPLQKKPGRKPTKNPASHSFVHFGMLVPPKYNQSASIAGHIMTPVRWTDQQSPTATNQPVNNTVPIPLTKKELAKKRSFAELVDLTQDASDEEDKIQQMKARLDMIQDLNNAPVNSSSFSSIPGPVSDVSPSNFVDLTLHTEKKKNKKRYEKNAPRSGLGSTGVAEENGLDLSQFKYAKSQNELLTSHIIIRPMNKKTGRSTYNPKTIARDILVSAGKHHSMPPLNRHYEIIRRRFAFVDYDSDLNTFRWDLADPGGPDVPSAEFQEVDMNDADDEDVGMSNDIQMERHRMQAVSTVGGENILASGTNMHHPTKILPGMKKWRHSRIGGIGGNGRGRPGYGIIPTNGQQNVIISDHNTSNQNHGLVEVLEGSSRIVEDLEEGSMNFVRNPDESDIVGSNLIISPRPHKPRGRPPGSGKKFRKNGIQPGLSQKSIQPSPHFQVTPQSSSQPHETTSDSTPRKKGRPAGSKNRTKPENTGNLPATAPTVTHPMASDNIPLRPSGLRNIVSPDGIAVVIDPHPHSTGFDVNEKKRKIISKEPRKKSKPSSMQFSEPNFKIYKCFWKNCFYELHNLETLQKHVRKHRDEFGAGPFPCLWENCNVTQLSAPEPFEFESDAAWDRHMKKHVDRYAWEFGDGPSTHPSDTDVSDYLSDSQGRRVTPLVTADSTAPPDPLPFSAGKRAARAYHKAHGNITDAQKAKAEADSANA